MVQFSRWYTHPRATVGPSPLVHCPYSGAFTCHFRPHPGAARGRVYQRKNWTTHYKRPTPKVRNGGKTTGAKHEWKVVRKSFTHLFLCIFWRRIYFLHLKRICGTINGLKLQILVNFRSRDKSWFLRLPIWVTKYGTICGTKIRYSSVLGWYI